MEKGDRPQKSFADWVAEKDAEKQARIAQALHTQGRRKAEKAIVEVQSKEAFAQWTKRVEAYDKALLALGDLAVDASSSADAEAVPFKNVARALAFVELYLVAPPLASTASPRTGPPRPSSAAPSSSSLETNNGQHNTFKAFKNYSRKHKAFETLRVPASIVKDHSATTLLARGCEEVTGTAGAWELSSVRYSYPPPGAALTGGLSEDDHFRNLCFDAAIKAAWETATSEAKAEVIAAVKSAAENIAASPGTSPVPPLSFSPSASPAGGRFGQGGKPGEITLASALASSVGQRYCLEKGTRWLQARKDTLKAQAAKKKAADEAEAKAQAKARHASWLKGKTQAKTRGRSSSRGGGAGGGKTAEDEDEEAAEKDRALLPRMDFSMGTSGRVGIVGPVRPSSASATMRRGRSRSHSPSAEEAKGFAIWSAVKEAIAMAEDCLTLLEFPSVSHARMLNGGSIPEGYPLSVSEDDKALMKTVGFACKSIHASALFEPWSEWACQHAGLFNRNQTASAWKRFDARGGLAENDLVGGSATSDYEHARANNLLPSGAAAAIKLLQSLCAEGKARRQHGKRAAAEKAPAAPTLVRAVHLEAPPRFVYGAAEVVAAARLHYKGGVGVAVPDGCPVLALGGTGVGAEVVLQWWLGADEDASKADPDGVQLPYACTVETCGIAGGKDQVEGNWTQVAMDPPDPLSILTSAPASSYVPLSVKAQGLGPDTSVPSVAKPGVDTFAVHHNGDRTRMRGCIRIVGLAPNSSYCYRVRAYNRVGASTYAFMIVTTAPCAPPSPILARPSVTPLALLSPADAAEIKALKNAPAAAIDSVRLCWSLDVCRRAALCRLLRVFDLAVAITAAASISGGSGATSSATMKAGSAASGGKLASAEATVLLRCISKEYGLHAFLSTALATPDTWPSMELYGANDDEPPAPASVMEALVALSRYSPSGPVFVTLPKLLSLFASDHAALVPYIGGGGQLQLEVVQRDASLLSLGVGLPLGSAAGGADSSAELPTLSPAAVAALSNASVDTRFVLTKCVSDRYEQNQSGSAAAAAGVEQIWEDASVGMRSVRTVGKLQAGCAYAFRVQAVNKDGIPSPPSFVGTAVTLLPKPATLKSATVRGSTSPDEGAGATSPTPSPPASSPATMSSSLTWSFGGPPGSLPRGAPPPTSATVLPPVDGSSSGNGNGNGSSSSASAATEGEGSSSGPPSGRAAATTSATDSHVAALLKQLQTKKQHPPSGHSTSAAGGAAAALAGASDASESLADPSRWFSLRRLWDKAVRLGTVLETVYLSGRPAPSPRAGSSSPSLSDDKVDVFQLRGLLADAGVFEECCSKPAAELATDYLRPPTQHPGAAAAATVLSPGNPNAQFSPIHIRPVIECLHGISPSNADRVRWASILQGLCKVPFDQILAKMQQQQRLMTLASGGPDAALNEGVQVCLSHIPVPTSATTTFSTLKSWWDNWLFAGRLDAKGRPFPQADAIPIPDPAVEGSWLTTCTPSFGYGVLYLIEMQEFESASSSLATSSASSGGSLNTSLDASGIGSLLQLNNSAATLGGTAAAGASKAGTSAAAKPWRIAAVSHECRMRLSELVPHSRFKVRVSAISRGSISHPTAPITVTTPPLAPFAAVPIRTTPRSVSVRWYPAEGGACKFILQLRKVGSLIQLAAQQGYGGSIASLTQNASSGSTSSLFHGRNMSEAAARHLAVGAVSESLVRSGHQAGAGAAAGPRWIEEMGSGAIGMQGSFSASASSSAAGSMSSASSGSGGGWNMVYSGPQCFAVVTGLVAGMVYRLRVIAEGYNGQMSLPSVETQIITPQAVIGDGGFGPSTLLPERAADQFRVPVSLINCAAILSSVFNQPASALSLTSPSDSSALALQHAPDVVVGDVIVWTEPVYADLPSPIADAIAYHYMRPSSSNSRNLFDDGASGSGIGSYLESSHHDGDDRESAMSTDLLSAQIIRQIAEGIVKGGREAPMIVAATAAAAAAAAASGAPPPIKGPALFDFSTLPAPPPGMRRIFICRRTIAATVLLDSASGVTSGSAVVKPVSTSSMPAPASTSILKVGSVTSAAGGEGGWKEEEDRPSTAAAAAGTPTTATDLGSEIKTWNSRVLTLSVEWCSVGPPEQPAGAGAAYPGSTDGGEGAGGHTLSFLGLARPYHAPIVSAVSKRYGVPAGVILKRQSSLLGDVGPFRVEWEDEAGRWSVAEEVAASVLQREHH